MENTGTEIARRFDEALDDTFLELLHFPNIGAPKKVRGRKFAGIRMVQVKGFSNYLVFYLSREKGITVERVFHAKQDYLRMLR